MACALDLTGLVPTAKADTTVTLKLIAPTATIQRASINKTDISDDIDATGTILKFDVPAGTNTMILVLLPPPTGEAMQLVEDCGGGNTQPIISFGSGIHASISFNIIAS
jgi:hypothetical protein